MSANTPTTSSSAEGCYHYLIRISLCNTSDPVVSRIISVPDDALFSELHEVIAAAFGWRNELCTSWVFRFNKGNPLDRGFVPCAAGIWFTDPDEGYDIEPSREGHDKEMRDFLQPGRYWTYDYNISRYCHAIEIVDQKWQDGKPTIRCLGGQGSIKRQAWQFSEPQTIKNKTEAETMGSSWDLDLTKMLRHMDVVLARYYRRRTGEATFVIDGEAVAKIDDKSMLARRLREPKRRLPDSP